MRTISLSRLVFWALLALPAAFMINGVVRGGVLPMDMLHPSGETSVRLMILALLPGPMADFFGHTRFLKVWLSIRRNLGVAAFAYALLHLVIYVMDMRLPAAMIDELSIPGIWTGWLALILMILPAAISFDSAMRKLGRKWKQAQRLVYAALFVGLAHWILLDWHWVPAIVHLTPLMIAWSLRVVARHRRNLAMAG